jgi:hypothetical protein
MALTIVQAGSNVSTTDTLTLSVSVTAAVGTMLVVCVAASNDASGGGPSLIDVTDAAGNTYTSRGIINYDPGATSAGSTLGIFTAPITSALSAANVTANFNPLTIQTAMVIHKVTPAAGQTVTFRAQGAGATGNATSYSITASAVASGDTIFGAAAIETDDTVTADSDTTNGSWSAQYLALADGGADASTETIVAQYKTTTGAGDQTYDPTTVTGRDAAWNWITIYEAASETITVDKWYPPLVDPVRIKPRLATAAQQAAWFVQAAPFAEATTVDRWFSPFALPVRTKARAAEYRQPDYYPFPIFVAEEVTVDKWYQRLQQPHPAKRPLRAGAQQFLVFYSEPVISISWFKGLEEPVRTKPRLREALQQHSAFVKTDPFPEAVSIDRWQQPFSEPVRVKRRTADFPYLAFVKADPFPESVTVDRWLLGLSEPVRCVRRTADYPALTFYPLPFVPWDWRVPLSEPTRRQPRTTDFPALWLVKAAPFEETTTVDRYWQPLSEPRGRRFPASQQQALAWSDFTPASTENVTLDKWFAPLAEPIRVRARLATASQQAAWFVKADPFAETVSIDRWLRPLSEPVRRRPGLSEGLQQFFTLHPAPIIVPPEPEIVPGGDDRYEGRRKRLLWWQSDPMRKRRRRKVLEAKVAEAIETARNIDPDKAERLAKLTAKQHADRMLAERTFEQIARDIETVGDLLDTLWRQTIERDDERIILEVLQSLD